MSPLGAVSSEGSSGEAISHFATIRVRAYGNAQLLMTVFSLDDILMKTLVPFKLVKLNRIVSTRIVNFSGQRVSFEFRTSSPNELFKMHRIVIFAKHMYSSYPGS